MIWPDRVSILYAVVLKKFRLVAYNYADAYPKLH
jgi:hypothetical protein